MAEAGLRRPPQIAPTPYLRALPPAGRWMLNAGAEARARLAPVWGTGFSIEACRASAEGSRAALWLGPDEYLLLDLAGGRDPETHAATRRRLEEALQGAPHSLVDVGHRQFAVEIAGPHATSMLSAACPLDLDARFFPIGMCTRTVLAKAEVVLWRTQQNVFHIEAWRSFAAYLAELFAEIAREFDGVDP